MINADELMHYGIKKRSGRYPWGSGGNAYQHSGDFLSRVEELRKENVTYTDYNGKTYTGDTAIAKTMKMSTTDLRLQEKVAKHERRQLEVDRANSLRSDGLTLTEIAKEMGYANESSIRSLLNKDTETNKNKAYVTADRLREELVAKGVIDISAGVEIELGVSRDVLREAAFLLETEGWERDGVGVKTVLGKGKQTNTEVLHTPDITLKEIYNDTSLIKPVTDYHSTDGGLKFDKREYPASVSSDRVHVRYGDEGGTSKDGVIELRRNVADLSLGNSHYAQVRILVDGTHYLKGMAMYSDNMPDGADIVFNTNKKSSVAKMDTLKPISTDDPDNPFGAYIKANGQSTYADKDGNKQLSAINKLKEEGDWDTMSKNLSSQFLSKQPMALINKQLTATYKDYQDQYDEIASLTNPTIKKKLLLEFADTCDSAVCHLKAAALPRQKTQVLLPLSEIKDTEIYAPNYKNGEQVALIRYPHGGTFEIPVLTVNNNSKAGKDILGSVMDAVGIHPNVAERLSGADFDGDTATVIPLSDKVRIKSTKALEGLKDFNAKDEYAYHEGMTIMTKANTGKQMGVISNLITDMTLGGATPPELTRAVKHSMVVIDAAKHKLDYKQSEKDNGIKELKKKYQAHINDDGYGGAATLLSKRKQGIQVAERKGSGIIDRETGKMVYKESGRSYETKKKVQDLITGKIVYEGTGKIVNATTSVKLLNHVDDIRTLSSGTLQEDAYASYANKMKALANTARKEYTVSGKLVYNKEANKKYAEEVKILDTQLSLAQRNAPKERQAQAIANSVIKAKTQANDITDSKTIKKISAAAIAEARVSVGASGKESKINITDATWEAIQAGAISDSKLASILRYTDTEAVKIRATPKTTTTMSANKENKMKAMLASGNYTNAQIAEALGVSTSTIVKYNTKQQKGDDDE